jgi:hypothetical protein
MIGRSSWLEYWRVIFSYHLACDDWQIIIVRMLASDSYADDRCLIGSCQCWLPLWYIFEAAVCRCRTALHAASIRLWQVDSQGRGCVGRHRI